MVCLHTHEELLKGPWLNQEALSHSNSDGQVCESGLDQELFGDLYIMYILYVCV